MSNKTFDYQRKKMSLVKCILFLPNGEYYYLQIVPGVIVSVLVVSGVGDP